MRFHRHNWKYIKSFTRICVECSLIQVLCDDGEEDFWADEKVAEKQKSRSYCERLLGCRK